MNENPDYTTQLDAWKRKHGLRIVTDASVPDTRSEALRIFEGSDGDATKAFYTELERLGVVGVVAMNLFRAQKCSSRAKGYRRRSHSAEAYDRKNWSMQNLCAVLIEHAEALKMTWGWKLDPKAEFHKWVLYVELPTGQASFHSAARGDGPDYLGDWDGKCLSQSRIVEWVETLL